MKPHLNLVRGLPGSGKSTFAKTFKAVHYEADMFFMRQGDYKFDPSKLKAAHTWCQQETMRSLLIGCDVVVSNTFTKEWELEPYLSFKLPVSVVIWRCNGDYGSVHDIPEEALKRMKDRFVDIKGEVIVTHEGDIEVDT